jgi:hypothetical protein
MISIGTALLASTVTFGLVYFFGAASAVKSFAHSMLDSTTFATLANFFGIGTVSGLSGLVLHDGLDLLIGRKTGVAKAAAHDLMLGMQADLAQGKSVSPEQVYAALVAGDPTLAARIAEEFSRPYERMSGAQQQKAMDKIGVADEMLELATAINSREVSPGHLAYMMGDAAPKPAARPVTDEAPRSNFVGRLGLAPSAAASHVERLQQQPQFATERIV